MSLDLATVRKAIANAIDIEGLATYWYTTTTPQLPCAAVGLPETIDYEADYGDLTTMVIPVTVVARNAGQNVDTEQALSDLASASSDRSVYRSLNERLGDALGDDAQTFSLGMAENFGAVTIGNNTHLGFEILVTVTG